MKNFFLIIAAQLLLLSYGCNNSQEKAHGTAVENETSAPLPAANCNEYFIRQADAEAMILAFKTYYTKNNRIPSDFDVDAKFIDILHRYISSKNDTIDGISLYYGLSNNTTQLIMVPTTALLYPTAQKKHVNLWNSIDFSSSTHSLTVNLSEEEAMENIAEFGKLFRGETSRYSRYSAKNDSLSAAIWINSCVIEKLDIALKHDARLKGVRFCGAAYTPKVKPGLNVGQRSAIQSTFIIAPVKSDNTIAWDIMIPKDDKDVYNHSQLCPNICN